jgi:multidrug transporter EmrE-like cation transporter
MGLSLEALVSIVIAAIVTAVANVLIRAGIERFGGFSPATLTEVGTQFFSLLLQPLFLVGFILYFVAALVWFRTIAIAPLTIAYPVLVSLTFAAVTIAAIIMWDEQMNLHKLLGLLMMLIGITLVSTSSDGPFQFGR